jgi:hypothetical protein
MYGWDEKSKGKARLSVTLSEPARRKVRLVVGKVARSRVVSGSAALEACVLQADEQKVVETLKGE